MTNKDRDPPGEASETQQVNSEDVELDSLPEAPVRVSRPTPPPLPPMSLNPPVSSPPFSQPQPDEAPKRGPLFFVGLLVAVLLVGVLAGTAMSVFRKPAPPPAASAKKGPAVINMPVQDMDDVPDGGP